MSTCSTCKYLNTNAKAPACRRYPPRVSYVVVPKHNVLTGRMEPSEESLAGFPTVRPDWSCGEWMPKPELTS